MWWLAGWQRTAVHHQSVNKTFRFFITRIFAFRRWLLDITLDATLFGSFPLYCLIESPHSWFSLKRGPSGTLFDLLLEWMNQQFSGLVCFTSFYANFSSNKMLTDSDEMSTVKSNPSCPEVIFRKFLSLITLSAESTNVGLVDFLELRICPQVLASILSWFCKHPDFWVRVFFVLFISNSHLALWEH